VSRWAQIRDAAVLYEDRAVLVLNKPAGLAVMGERHDTDLVRLAEAEGEKLYPAHRIDKVTSGALLLAKDLGLHGDLTRQFNRRTVDKVYLAMTRSTGLPQRGAVELPLSVGRKNRVRVAANRAEIAFDASRSRWSVPPEEEFQQVRTYPSVTTFCRVWGDEQRTLLAVHPVTGRRHQIRVHLAWIGHPIEGDPLFDRASSNSASSGPAGGAAAASGAAPSGAAASGGPGTGRTMLHSWRLGFDAAWAGGTRIRVEAPPGPDFWAALDRGPVPLPDWDTAREALEDSEPHPAAPPSAGPSRRKPHSSQPSH
jgi:tRNA pseudouridine32 synthase/23S rRNA pseudouridine746 synthase/23S rRNA pseudouridine1911/1915/1917 synthase